MNKYYLQFKNFDIHFKFIVLMCTTMFINTLLFFSISFCYLLYLLVKGNILSIFKNDKYLYLLLIPLLSTTINSLIYRNLIGFVFSLTCISFFLFYIKYREYITKEKFEILLHVILYSSLFSVIIGFFQYIRIYYITGSFSIQEHPDLRVFASFMNSSYYSTVLEFVIIISMFYLLKPKLTTTKSYIYLLILLLNILMLYLTGTRMAWAAIALAVNVLFITCKYYKTFTFFIIFELSFIYFTIFKFKIFPRVDSIVDYFLGRVDLWVTGLKEFMLHPIFGQGYFSYIKNYELVDGTKDVHSHSLYVESLLIFGLFFLTLIAIYICRSFIKLIKNRSNPYFPLSISVIVTLLIHGTGDVTLLNAQVFLLFFILVSSINNFNKKTNDFIH